MRSEREEPFGQAEVDLIDAVGPHIARAARIAGLLQGVNLYKEGLEAAANELAFGLLLLDRRGRVLFANAAAERLLAAGRIRCRLDGRLAGSSVAADRSLSEFLRRLARFREAVAVRLSDETGAGLRLIGAPLPSRRREFACLAPFAQDMALVFGVAATPPPPARLIAELYGLTPAVCRLVTALLAGETLADYAERGGLTRNTVKTQLRSVFAKTDTARQSDLMRKLIKLSAVFASA
jgi:DNA-binding CsgD family transcriptional regulator